MIVRYNPYGQTSSIGSSSACEPGSKETSARHLLAFALTDGLQQHTVPMKIQEMLLAAGKSSHVDDLCGIDSHAL